MTYAVGKISPGICDRCGFRWLLSQLKTETVNRRQMGNLVCPDCWDADHPQNEIGRVRVSDPHPLKDPRPDRNTDRGLFGWNPVGNPSTQAEGMVGFVRVEIS